MKSQKKKKTKTRNLSLFKDPPRRDSRNYQKTNNGNLCQTKKNG